LPDVGAKGLEGAVTGCRRGLAWPGRLRRLLSFLCALQLSLVLPPCGAAALCSYCCCCCCRDRTDKCDDDILNETPWGSVCPTRVPALAKTCGETDGGASLTKCMPFRYSTGTVKVNSFMGPVPGLPFRVPKVPGALGNLWFLSSPQSSSVQRTNIHASSATLAWGEQKKGGWLRFMAARDEDWLDVGGARRGRYVSLGLARAGAARRGEARGERTTTLDSIARRHLHCSSAVARSPARVDARSCARSITVLRACVGKPGSRGRAGKRNERLMSPWLHGGSAIEEQGRRSKPASIPWGPRPDHRLGRATRAPTVHTGQKKKSKRLVLRTRGLGAPDGALPLWSLALGVWTWLGVFGDALGASRTGTTSKYSNLPTVEDRYVWTRTWRQSRMNGATTAALAALVSLPRRMNPISAH